MIVAACATTPDPRTDAPDLTSHVATFAYSTGTYAPELDVLFVIDDTPAMAPFRAGVVASAARLAEALEPDGLPSPSLHFAVTTADAIAGGALHQTAAAPHGYLSDILTPEGVRVRSYPGGLVDALAGVLDVGAASTSPNEPLEAARLALGTQGFRRPGARLVLVVIAAQDDASPADVSSYSAPWLDPAQQTTFVIGIYPRPAPRLDALLATFGQRGMFTAIDQADFGAVLDPLAQIWTSSLACPCAPRPLDLDPATPGDQVDCSIVATLEGDTGLYDQQLPACPAEGPCWRFDPGCCPAAPDVEFQIVGAGLRYQPPFFGQCVVGDGAGE